MTKSCPETTWADVNEHGVWCPHCGEIIEASWNIDDEWEEPAECRSCGFPEDLELMAETML